MGKVCGHGALGYSSTLILRTPDATSAFGEALLVCCVFGQLFSASFKREPHNSNPTNYIDDCSGQK